MNDMSGKTILIGLKDVLVRYRPFSRAHEQWFAFFANMLQDSSVKDYASDPAWGGRVDDVMARFIPNIPERLRNNVARDVYAQLAVKNARSSDVVRYFFRFLTRFEEAGGEVDLITSFPSEHIKTLLQRVGCNELIGHIQFCSFNLRPCVDKGLGTYVSKHGQPDFFIGKRNKFLTTCREKGILTIGVDWASYGQVDGDYNVRRPRELESIIQ